MASSFIQKYLPGYSTIANGLKAIQNWSNNISQNVVPQEAKPDVAKYQQTYNVQPTTNANAMNGVIPNAMGVNTGNAKITQPPAVQQPAKPSPAVAKSQTAASTKVAPVTKAASTVPAPKAPSPSVSDSLARIQLMQENENLAKYGTAAAPQTPTTPTAPITAATVTETPVSSSDTRSATLKALQDRYLASLGASPEEIAAQKQLDDLVASKDLGLAATSEQPIEMGFVTGQQAAIERRAALQAEPLKAKLAALQASRKASQDQAKSELDFAQAEDNKYQPMQVGNSLVRFNAETGKYENLYTAPAETKPVSPVTVSAGESLVDPNTGEVIYGGSQDGTNQYKASDYDIQQDAQTGAFYRINKVTGQVEPIMAGNGQFSTSTAASVANEQTKEKTNAQTMSAIQAISDLENSPGLNPAVGFKGLTNYLPGTAAQSFKAQLERVKGLLTLPALQQMKGFGVLSDRDMAVIQSSIAALNTNMSENDFRTELSRIKTALSNSLTSSGSSSESNNDFDF